MPNPTLHFAKIVATPTETSWSQVYNAGSLFAVVSLTSQEAPATPLASLGKELFNALETEFFTLSEKNLTSITQAITASCAHVPEDLLLSFCAGFIKENILYLFVMGGGQIVLKRGEKTGVLLKQHATDHPTRTIRTGSGHLTTNDVVFLATSTFASLVSKEKLDEALHLELPNDIAETLSPTIHGTTEGGAAAICLVYKGMPTAAPAYAPEEPETDTTPPEHPSPRPTPHPSYAPPHEMSESPEEKEHRPNPVATLLQKIRLPNVRVSGINYKRKIIVGIAVTLLVILGYGIMTVKKQQEQAKVKAAFEKVYPEAKSQFDQGEELEGLNSNLAQEDYQKAKKLLEESKDQFPEGSEEAQKIAALLAQINDKLSGTSTSQQARLQKVDDASSALLRIAKANAKGTHFAEDEKYVYFTTDTGIQQADKSNDKVKEIVKKDDDWKKIAGIGTFLGNVYIVDTTNGVIKYAAGNFAKSSYFSSDVKPDLDDAVSMSIDGSVWILKKDGSILKFTRGSQNDFEVKGLKKPLTSPAQIVTHADFSYVYVLDKGTGSIVRLTKDGSVDAQIQANELKNARLFTISSDEKKALILIQDAIYELPLQ